MRDDIRHSYHECQGQDPWNSGPTNAKAKRRTSTGTPWGSMHVRAHGGAHEPQAPKDMTNGTSRGINHIYCYMPNVVLPPRATKPCENGREVRALCAAINFEHDSEGETDTIRRLHVVKKSALKSPLKTSGSIYLLWSLYQQFSYQSSSTASPPDI